MPRVLAEQGFSTTLFKNTHFYNNRERCGEVVVIITTSDPITGELLHDLDSKPFVIEGAGNLAIKVYFESEETRRSYLLGHISPVSTTGLYSY